MGRINWCLSLVCREAAVLPEEDVLAAFADEADPLPVVAALHDAVGVAADWDHADGAVDFDGEDGVGAEADHCDRVAVGVVANDGVEGGGVGVLGKEAGEVIDRTGDAYKNRLKLIDAMDTLAAGLAARKQRVPAEKELFNRALLMEFGNLARNTERKAIAAKLKKRRTIARPSGREAEPITEEQKALQELSKAMGVPLEVGDGTELGSVLTITE